MFRKCKKQTLKVEELLSKGIAKHIKDGDKRPIQIIFENNFE
mgnify:CR=1 FL=1